MRAMEELLKEIRQYRKEQAELFEWTRKNGHPKMASFDEGGLNACDKIIAIVERAIGKCSDELSNCNKPHVSGSVCRITKAQIESIWQAKEDMKAMLGCGEDDSLWKRYIKNMEKFLISNGLTTN